MNLIWATRGRSWGFRFLLRGGIEDPLATYERAFEQAEGERTYLRHADGMVAIRFADPSGRCDEAGRVIPHDVVILASPRLRLASVEEGVELVWPLMESAYDKVWDLPRAPQSGSVRLAEASD